MSSERKPSNHLDPLAVFQLLSERDLEPGRARKLGSSAAYRALCSKPTIKEKVAVAVTRRPLSPNT
jgi:hypothetical protein